MAGTLDWLAQRNMLHWKRRNHHATSAVPTLAGLRVPCGRDNMIDSGVLHPWATLGYCCRVRNEDTWQVLNAPGGNGVLLVKGHRARHLARQAYARALRQSWRDGSLSMEADKLDASQGSGPLVGSVAVMAAVVGLLAYLLSRAHAGIDWAVFPRLRVAWTVTVGLFIMTVVLPLVPLVIAEIRRRRRCHLTFIRLDAVGITATLENDSLLTICWQEIRDLDCSCLYLGLVRARLVSGREVWLGRLPPRLHAAFKVIQKELLPDSARHEHRAKLERRLSLALLTVVGSMATGVGVDYFNYDPANPEPARRAAGWIFLVGATIASAWFVGPGMIERLEARGRRRNRRYQQRAAANGSLRFTADTQRTQ